MPAGLWGRAESIRTTVRSLAQALAPLVFGGLADLIAGISPEQAPIGTHPGPRERQHRPWARDRFLIMLVTLAAGVSPCCARVHLPAETSPPPAVSHQGLRARRASRGRRTHTLKHRTVSRSRG